jgi:hypothetical protein
MSRIEDELEMTADLEALVAQTNRLWAGSQFLAVPSQRSEEMSLIVCTAGLLTILVLLLPVH